MRLPLLWLHDFCDPGLEADALGRRLALTGTELERIHRHGVGALEFFVVGRVLSAERHPNADRLTVCAVDVGEAEPAAIVCGAPNVAVGQTVAVARPGAVMPDGTRLGRAKLRGVVSEGMILAEDELAIGPDHDGIMVLDPGPQPGSPLAGVLPLATEVLELEITPNRPDCLGVYGLAREVHAATGAPLAAPPWSVDPGTSGPVAGVQVQVRDPGLCPRFTARVFEDVTVGPSPPWLKARLSAAGQRPISNVVDITNFVMLLCGQPLHAFDLDRVAGQGLIVRRAVAGERLRTLDGTARELDPDMVVVCDAHDAPSALGGVMGGAESEVCAQTTRVLLEAATWDGPNIQRTSTRLALRSEASARFEKGLAPEQALEGQAVATALMLELCGATLRPGTVDVGGDGPPARTIRLRDARVAALLGQAVPRARSAELLAALGFDTAQAPDGLDVGVPSFRRGDVVGEADLIEEVARMDGLERLPSTLPARRGANGLLTALQRRRRRLEDALAGCGLHELVGWSFTAPDVPGRLRLAPPDPRARPVAVANPMSEDQRDLRTLLLGSLLEAARLNVARGESSVGLFELGAVHRQAGGPGLPDERRHVAALLVGSSRPATWRSPAAPADLFALRGVLDAALAALRVNADVFPGDEPFLHPGRSARLRLGEQDVGWLGELHPSVAAAWDLPGGAAFELDLDALLGAGGQAPVYRDLTSYPAVRRDLALVVGEEVSAGSIVAAARDAGPPELAGADVFDRFVGEQVGQGRVSLAVRLQFRAADRTLTDAEVDAWSEAVVVALGDRTGARLRA